MTSKQIAEISEAALIKDFEADQIIYERKEQAKNLFILLEGEVSLRVPSRNDTSIESLSLEIEKIAQHGALFGTNLLFDVKRYMTRARVIKPCKVMILDAEKFLEILELVVKSLSNTQPDFEINGKLISASSPSP